MLSNFTGYNVAKLSMVSGLCVTWRNDKLACIAGIGANDNGSCVYRTIWPNLHRKSSKRKSSWFRSGQKAVGKISICWIIKVYFNAHTSVLILHKILIRRELYERNYIYLSSEVNKYFCQIVYTYTVLY